MKSHKCIDCKLSIIPKHHDDPQCKCDFKSLVVKEKPKLMQTAKEVQDYIVWLANVESNKSWALTK